MFAPLSLLFAYGFRIVRIPLKPVAPVRTTRTVAAPQSAIPVQSDIERSRPNDVEAKSIIERKWTIYVAVFAFFRTLSTTIEVIQYVTSSWRVADVDDVILNSCGGLAAFVVARYAADRWRTFNQC